MKVKKIVFAVTLASSCFALNAQAGLISYEFGSPIPLETTEISQTGNLSLFDSTMGTLTGATLDLFGGASFTYGGTNNSAQAQNARITSSTELLWSSSLGALSPILAGNNISLSSNSGVMNYTVGQTRNFGPFLINDTSSSDLFGILASLQNPGGGIFSLTCDSLSGLSVTGGGGNISTTQSTQAGCGARISYNFDTDPPSSVPTPGSLPLFGLGLTGALALRRRRKKV